MSTSVTTLVCALGVTLLVFAGSGCATRGGIEPESPDSGATIVVENNAFLDVNVYVVRSGTRIRIGTVTGISKRTFDVPRTVVGTGTPVRFQADFIGSSRTPVSEEMVIWPGDEVRMLIPAA